MTSAQPRCWSTSPGWCSPATSSSSTGTHRATGAESSQATQEPASVVSQSAAGSPWTAWDSPPVSYSACIVPRCMSGLVSSNSPTTSRFANENPTPFCTTVSELARKRISGSSQEPGRSSSVPGIASLPALKCIDSTQGSCSSEPGEPTPSEPSTSSPGWATPRKSEASVKVNSSVT